MTDGYIGNEQQILGTLHDKLGASRIFSFGVGNSPNRFLMDRCNTRAFRGLRCWKPCSFPVDKNVADTGE